MTTDLAVSYRGAGINPATGQWAQEPVWHDWPGPLDYLTNDNLLSNLSYRSQGYGDTIPDLLGGMLARLPLLNVCHSEVRCSARVL